jgi:uncharacterized protein YgiM (DUF1202 family)
MLRNGQYALKVVPLQEGLPEFQEKITITKGVLTVVDRKFGKGVTSEGSIISLSPLENKKTSELLILSYPDKSDVFIDEQDSGKTPLLTKNTTDSDHTLRLRHVGYKDKNVRIRTPAGYKLTATIYLSLTGETQSTPSPNIASPSATLSTSPTMSKTTPTPTKPGVSPTIVHAGKVTILQTPNGFLRVRQQPTTTSPEISQVSPGQTFSYTEEQNGWYYITLTNGTKGWISGQYATK